MEPRRGLTRKLLYHAQAGERGGAFGSRWMLFSGPHEISAPVDEYESILLIGTGFEMTALLPYLQELIHDYQTRKVCTRRIRVIWQVRHIETALVMQPLLNNALKGDNLDKILSISIFSTYLKEEKVSFDRRGTVSRGSTDATGTFRVEMKNRHTEDANRDIEAAQGETEHEQETMGKMQKEKGRMLVMGKVSKYLIFHD